MHFSYDLSTGSNKRYISDKRVISRSETTITCIFSQDSLRHINITTRHLKLPMQFSGLFGVVRQSSYS